MTTQDLREDVKEAIENFMGRRDCGYLSEEQRQAFNDHVLRAAREVQSVGEGHPLADILATTAERAVTSINKDSELDENGARKVVMLLENEFLPYVNTEIRGQVEGAVGGKK